MSFNHLNSLFGTESYRRNKQNYLVTDVKVDPFKMEILCMQSAQTLEIVSRSHESIELRYPVLWAVLRSQYCYSQENLLVL